MAETLRVNGVKEFIADAEKAEKETKKLVRGRLRDVAKPVLRESRRKLAAYDARSASRLGISLRKAGTVSVEQRMRRTTGAHPQFGALQQHQVLEPTLDEQEDNINREFTKAVDDVADILAKG
jgi:hypothetical protein